MAQVYFVRLKAIGVFCRRIQSARRRDSPPRSGFGSVGLEFGRVGWGAAIRMYGVVKGRSIEKVWIGRLKGRCLVGLNTNPV
jgi:hypothetical protein